MLQAGNSCMAQQAVPLLLHCICMPYGASTLCNEIENIYNNEDWMKRLSAGNLFSLYTKAIGEIFCDLLISDILAPRFDSLGSGSVLVPGEPMVLSSFSVGAFHLTLLRRMLSFERSRNPETRLRFFFREVDYTKWFPVAFLTSGVF